MAQRRASQKVDAKAALMRLQTSARPLSEQGDTLPDKTPANGDVSQDVTGNVSPEQAIEPEGPKEFVTEDVSSHGTLHESEYVTDNDAPNVALDAPSHVTADDVRDDASHVLNDVSDDGTLNGSLPGARPVAHHVASPVTGHVLRSDTDAVPPVEVPITTGKPVEEGEGTPTPGDGMVVRIRGRWTDEQRDYLAKLAKKERATAGEVIRYIAAWFLAHGAEVEAARAKEPTTITLIKRERGLKVFDFLTTTDQAEAIKRSACNGGEAAWLRRAVDAHKASTKRKS